MPKYSKEKPAKLKAVVTTVTFTGAASTIPEELPPRVMQCMARGDYAQACSILQPLSRTPWTRNTLGVCALRCGRVAQALDVFRALLLIPGTTVIRLEAEDIPRINFATALLLSGLPSGALAALADLKDPNHAAALQVKAAIRAWAKSLSFWRRWDWRINGCTAPNCQIPIDFEPGVLHFVVESKPTTPAGKSQPATPKLAL